MAGGLLAAVVAVVLAFALSPRVGLAEDGEAAPSADPTYVAQIGDVQYTSIDDAVSAAEEGSTIELLADCEMTQGFNKTLTFTGNG